MDAAFFASPQSGFEVSKAKDKPTNSKRAVANRFKEIAVLPMQKGLAWSFLPSFAHHAHRNELSGACSIEATKVRGGLE